VVVVIQHDRCVTGFDRLVKVQFEFFDRVHSHIKLKHLQARPLRLVIKVVNLEKVNLRNEPVGIPYLMRPVVKIGIDDGLRFAVKHLVGDHTGIAHDHVNHRVVIREVIEADHSTIGVAQVGKEHVQLLTLVAPRRDNESPARTVGNASDYDREEVGKGLDVITVIGVFTGHINYP